MLEVIDIDSKIGYISTETNDYCTLRVTALIDGGEMPQELLFAIEEDAHDLIEEGYDDEIYAYIPGHCFPLGSTLNKNDYIHAKQYIQKYID